jgi:hypothetical protein
MIDLRDSNKGRYMLLKLQVGDSFINENGSEETITEINDANVFSVTV